MSNKTLKRLAVEIELEHKAQKLGQSVILLFLVFIVLSGGLLIWKRFINSSNTVKLITPNKVLDAETAKTDSERAVGLSNRSELAENGGMIFYFENSSINNCFWMKDTLIPLDMIFLDSSKKIVTIHQNVSPSTYPDNFCPDTESAYGLEINPGKSQEYGLRVGATLHFD